MLGASLQQLVSLYAERYSRGSLGHGYIVVGQDSVSARLFAEALARVVAPTSYAADTFLVDPEEGSIGIAEVRALRDHLMSMGRSDGYRVGVVLQGERMTDEAQNALLKIAEEPPSHSLLILCVSDTEEVLPTLLSRTQRIVLPRSTNEEVAAWLVETQGSASEEAAKIADRAHGSLMRALMLIQDTDQALIQHAQALLDGSTRERSALAKQLADEGYTLVEVLRALSYELAYTERTPEQRQLWHRIQVLQRKAMRSPLNLRLQLAALFTD